MGDAPLFVGFYDVGVAEIFFPAVELSFGVVDLGEGNPAHGVECIGLQVVGVNGCACRYEFIYIWVNGGSEFGIAFGDHLHEVTKYFHVLVEGTAVLQLFGCDGEFVQAFYFFECDGVGHSALGQVVFGEVADDVVAVLGQEGGQVFCRLFEAVPVALFDPGRYAAAADV